MNGKTKAEKFVFPRVPLHLDVPPDLPDISRLNSISVVPVLDRYEVLNGEVELWGGYNLKVFYLPVKESAANNTEEGDDFDAFFGNLQMMADGLFDSSGERAGKPAADKSPVYSWELEKKFHTYAEVDGLKPGRKVRIQPVIEKIDLEVAAPRKVKGSLTVALDIKRG